MRTRPVVYQLLTSVIAGGIHWPEGYYVTVNLGHPTHAVILWDRRERIVHHCSGPDAEIMENVGRCYRDGLIAPLTACDRAVLAQWARRLAA